MVVRGTLSRTHRNPESCQTKRPVTPTCIEAQRGEGIGSPLHSKAAPSQSRAWFSLFPSAAPSIKIPAPGANELETGFQNLPPLLPLPLPLPPLLPLPRPAPQKAPLFDSQDFKILLVKYKMAQTLVMMLEKAKGLTNSFQSPPQIILALILLGRTHKV